MRPTSFLGIIVLGTLAAPTLANTQNCGEVFAVSIGRTVGAEIEFEDFSDPMTLRISDAARFQRQHALVSRNSSGLWVSNRIPAELLAKLSPDTVGLKNHFSLRFIENGETNQLEDYDPTKAIFCDELADGGFRIRNWGQLGAFDLQYFLANIFHARGQSGEDLKIAPNHSLVPNLPLFLSEEWSHGELQGFEYSMNGGSPTLPAAIHWTGTLRKDVVESDPTTRATQLPHTHYHVLYDIQSLPNANDRRQAYQDILDLAGDLNDLSFVWRLWLETQTVYGGSYGSALDGSTVNDHSAYTFGMHVRRSIGEILRQTNLRPYTAKMAASLRATNEGVDLVRTGGKPHEITLDDTNFPAAFKYLDVGIRGIYGQEAVSELRPVPKVGLEIRGLGRNDDVLADLFINPSASTDVIPRLSPRTLTERGLTVYSLEQVRTELATVLLPNTIDDLRASFASLRMQNPKYLKWRHDQMIGLVFWPLSRMIRAPVFRAALKKMPAHEAALAVALEERFFEAYLKNILIVQRYYLQMKKARGAPLSAAERAAFIYTMYSSAVHYAGAYASFFHNRDLRYYTQRH